MLIVDRINFISKWISDYAINSSKNPFNLVIGVSGGIDSAVTSTLCAKTNLKTIVVSMPIKQNESQHSLSLEHNFFPNMYELSLCTKADRASTGSPFNKISSFAKFDVL